MKKLNLLILIAIITCACNDIKKNSDYVNTFIGTGGHGHTYPGATMPFGMMQLSPDTRLEGWDGCGGYHFSDSIHLWFLTHTLKRNRNIRLWRHSINAYKWKNKVN